jgi:hypothetical protein
MHLFAVESMQTDIYMQQEQNAQLQCEKIECTALLPLIAAFRDSTNGIDPLCIDWDSSGSARMMDGDEDAVRSMRNLKMLMEVYGM